MANLELARDANMEVTITPSSSVYFAGEQLKVTITFTNLTAPSAVSKPHRRGHSISSAPLARPPTSPGVFTHKYAPSSPAIAPTTNPLNASRRRGLVGQAVSPEPPSVTRSKQIIPSKSLSTTISKSEIAHLALENASAGTHSPILSRYVSDGVQRPQRTERHFQRSLFLPITLTLARPRSSGIQ